MRSLCVRLAVLLLAVASGAAPLGPEQALHVASRQFHNRAGQPVALRGVNVGGWLVTEGWMCGQRDDGGRWALEQLEARFGPYKADILLSAWRDHWFTPRDLDTIAGWGFNLLRVPFGYRNLQDAAGQWRRDGHGAIDFGRLDWIVREAGRRGLYVILDLHIWPGEKEDYHQVSRLAPGGQEARERAAALWREVARHFRGEPAIAGFDLLNEPEGSPGDAAQHALADAIRAEDPDRILIGESMRYTNFADPAWRNAVWSGHYPDDKAAGTVAEKVARWEQREGLAGHPEVPAPVFIGELKAPQDTAASAFDLAQALNRRGWSWAVWCYKGVNVGGWAAFNYDASARYDLAKDSFESILDAWCAPLMRWQDPAQAKNYHWTDWWVDGYGRGAREP